MIDLAIHSGTSREGYINFLGRAEIIFRNNKLLVYSGAVVSLAIIMLLVFSYLGSGSFNVLSPPQEFNSTISGTVYDDSNDNKIFDVGEMGLNDVSIHLYNDTDLVATNTTDMDGGFSFVISELGVYTIVEEDPEYWYSTTPNEFEVSVEERTTQSFFVDFGDRPYNATILGVVYDDSYFDGVQDPGEDGIPGAGVGIYSDDTLLNQTASDIGGSC